MNPSGGDALPWLTPPGGMQCTLEVVAQPDVAAQHPKCFGAPRRSLIGVGAGFVLTLPGVCVGLLREFAGLVRRWWATVIGLELGRQCRPAHVDGRATFGPVPGQGTVDTDDFPDRPLAGVGACPVGEADAQTLDQQRLEAGVVPLGGGHVVLEERPTVQRQPLAVVLGLHLVRHRDVGVQIGVAGARVAVGERRCDEPVDLDLGDAALAAAGVGRVLLQPGDRVCDGVVVGLLDGRGNLAGATAQRVETLLTGEKDRSYPATAVVACREIRAR